MAQSVCIGALLLVLLFGVGTDAGGLQCDYLGSDVAASDATVGAAQYTVDSQPNNAQGGVATVQGLQVGGLHYDKGFFAHAPSQVTFNLDGAYQSISGCAGIATMAPNCGTASGDATFSVQADGTEIWTHHGAAGEHACFELAVDGVSDLVFVATDGSQSCAASAWTDIKACTSTDHGGAAVHACDMASQVAVMNTIQTVCCQSVDCSSGTPSACSQAW